MGFNFDVVFHIHSQKLVPFFHSVLTTMFCGFIFHKTALQKDKTQQLLNTVKIYRFLKCLANDVPCLELVSCI